MSIENPNIVDAAGIDKASGDVVLTIADHLPWDVEGHTRALETKINSYLSFIESGELLRSYPAAKGKRVRILVVCKHPATPQAESSLSRVAAVLRSSDIGFGWEHHAQPGAQADRPEEAGPAA